MMIASALGFALFLGLYGFIQARWWCFALLAFPHGVVWSGLLTSTMPILGDVLSERHRAAGIALYGLASPAGVIVGPMLGLTLFRTLGFPLLAFGMGFTFLLITGLTFSLPRDRETREPRPFFRRPERKHDRPLLRALRHGAGIRLP